MPSLREIVEIALWMAIAATLGIFRGLIWTGVCTLWHPIWTTLPAVLHVLWMDPLFQTGNTYLDNLLALGVHGVTLVALLDIFSRFMEDAKLAAEEEKRHPRTSRKLKLEFFELLGEKERGEEWVTESTVRKYLPGFLKRLVDQGLHPHFYAKFPRTLSQVFPHAPDDSSRTASVWGYFKLLAENSRSLWWTRQWFMRWMAWSIYVRIQCTDRNIDRWIAFEFTWLGYTTSLAGAQCLFFALLLSHPRRAKKSIAYLKSIPVVLSTLPEGILVIIVPLALVWDEKSRKRWPPGTYVVFTAVQTLLTAIPLVVVVSKAVIAKRSARLKMKQFWYALSVFSMILHATSTYFAFAEVNEDSWLGRFNGWPRQLNWFVPWRNESDAGVQEDKYVGASVFEILGEHPWINALGWDVLLSAAVLCSWSAFSSTEARDMIRCSVFPELEGGEDLEVEARSHKARSTRSTIRQSSRTSKHAKIRQDAQETGRSASRGRYSRADHAAGASGQGQWQDGFSKLRPWTSLLSTNEAIRRPDAGRAEEDQSLWPQQQEQAGEAEAAGLAWCLWVLGGLGMATAAVLGANQQEI
ncbi:hypothetical protein M409DRAFT_21631 [Zasmidium cellare ATCC 36951]|uniref:Uncharacterized protein n=1 Tax=Zasmidium cellare ATCC 36951 TaxID=1080233 RepID=A0A6A6CLT4_ZASCE|nr:uncharacterized protein M409DRAFT_21631 [Zasmidium cellare ATCC 36951]KAF2168187.1 hypothetical protein M409DRAFT_21631 [Zasmidium cellare ATCC 36951]